MNALFVAILLGCAWSAQSQCTYPNGENWNGGVLDGAGNYIASSVLAWIDIANNVRQFADPEGNTILNNWNFATLNFNDAYLNSPPLANIAGRTLGQAANSFGLLQYHVNNTDLAAFFGDTAKSFAEVLVTGGNPEINSYMINAYPNFVQKICNPA